MCRRRAAISFQVNKFVQYKPEVRISRRSFSTKQFPWRAAPPDGEELKKSSFLDRLALSVHPNVHEEVKAGARQAFPMMAAHVFGTSPAAIWGRGGSSYDTAPSSNGFEECLLNQFAKWKSDHAASGPFEATYRLHEIEDVHLIGCRFIMNHPRAEVRKEKSRPRGERMTACIYSLYYPGRRYINAASTYQLDVSISCKETFFVKDVVSNNVVQGSEESRDCEHHMRLEIPVFMVAISGTFVSQWEVIDLDHWLNGNDFWQEA